MFDEDLGQFFDTRDFAVAATIHLPGGTRQVNGIFNDPSQDVQLYDTAVETSRPFLQVLAASAAGVRKGLLVDVQGESYKVQRVARDGTGLATIHFD